MTKNKVKFKRRYQNGTARRDRTKNSPVLGQIYGGKMNDFFDYKTTELEKLKFSMNLRVSREALDKADSFILHRVSGYVWSQDAGKKVEFRYPADWREAFKERWFSNWLLKKFPVRYTYKSFQVKATYPGLNVQSHEPVLRLLETTDDWGINDAKIS